MFQKLLTVTIVLVLPVIFFVSCRVQNIKQQFGAGKAAVANDRLTVELPS